MKNLFLLFMAITISSCSKDNPKEFSAQSLNEKLITTEGQQVTFGEILDKNKGKTLVIEVWASWCGDCLKAMPKWKELQASHPDANYVLLSADKTQEAWKEAIEKYELEGMHYFIPDGMKGSFGNAIEIDWIPRYIVVDKNGKVAIYRAIETDFDTINNTLTDIK